MTPTTTSSRKRGDWVELQGTDMCRGVETSRLARIICGVEIRGVKKFLSDCMREDVWENQHSEETDTIVYLLVRYATAHPDVGRRRGPEHRPLCPGMRDTHCLWKWWERPATFRRGCWRPRPWARNRHLFGKTEAEQNLNKEKDARAWFDVIQIRNIIRHTNVRTDWDRPDSFFQSVMWC